MNKSTVHKYLKKKFFKFCQPASSNNCFQTKPMIHNQQCSLNFINSKYMLFMGDISFCLSPGNVTRRRRTRIIRYGHFQSLTSISVSIFPGGILFKNFDPGWCLFNSYTDYESNTYIFFFSISAHPLCYGGVRLYLIKKKSVRVISFFSINVFDARYIT